MKNDDIADIFTLLSKLMDVHGENSFKIKTYTNAAFNIEKLQAPLNEMSLEQIKAQQGIGVSVAQKIQEIISTGSLAQLNELLLKTPKGILEMMRIRGIGTKKINTIWKEMEIENIGELLYACKENRLKLFKGFGEKTQNKIAELIEFYQSNMGNHLYARVLDLANEIKQILESRFESQVFLAGDCLRQAPVVGPIIFVTTKSVKEINSALTSEKNLEVLPSDGEIAKFNFQNVSVQIVSSEKENIAYNIFTLSSSKEFLNSIQTQYPKISEASVTEFFNKNNLQEIRPSLWEDPSIIDHAKNNQIPAAIQVSDIHGLIHCHSTWSDGSNTLEEMAEGAMKYGLKYMLITDHSKSAFYANGLNETRIAAQQDHIDNLNRTFEDFRIYKGIECDILNDGSLDYDNETLAGFDCIIASIHSNLNMTEEKAMSRLMGAIENPYTSILGHMTGRLILSRAGYPVDHKEIIDACAYHNVVIELNANPNRLDIDWSKIDYALSKNVIISINPDAHSVKGIADIRYGVLAAQKSLLTPLQNLSSFTTSEFEEFLHDQHQKRN